MKLFVVFFTLLPLYIYNISAQQLPSETDRPVRCSTLEADSLLRAAYPALESRAQFESWLQRKIAERETDISTRAVVTIPVIVHIVHNGEPVGTGTNISAEQVMSQIDVLNETIAGSWGLPDLIHTLMGLIRKLNFVWQQLIRLATPSKNLAFSGSTVRISDYRHRRIA